MEEDNGLELSLGLGLSCGGSLAKDKGKIVCFSDNRIEESDDRGSKIIDDFKNFLQGGNNQRQDMGPDLLRSDSMKVKENFFNDLSQTHTDCDSSLNSKATRIWMMENDNRVDIQEEKQSETGNKRKMLFEEINCQKKHEGESCQKDVDEKAKASFTSTNEDGSAAENEVVGESELEGSTSRPVSQNNGHSDLSITDLSAQKKFNGSTGNDMELHNIDRGVPLPFSIQTTSIQNGISPPIVKVSHDAGASGSTGHSLHGIRQVFLAGNGEQCGVQTRNPVSLPLMGFSSSQLPTLVKDNSWGFISQPQLHNPCSRGQPSSGIPPNSAEVTQHDARTLEQEKVEGRQPIIEEGSFSRARARGSTSSLGAKDASELSAGGVLNEISAIKPGLAADVKFGGCGSFPNLPWVSTTSPGPNGRTISGVTYRYNANQIKIVCACHGTHMSPEDFVRHAGEERLDTDNETGLAPFSNNNPSTSTQN